MANEILTAQNLDLRQLQRKMESQQNTLAELLRVLRPKGIPSNLLGTGISGIPGLPGIPGRPTAYPAGLPAPIGPSVAALKNCSAAKAIDSKYGMDSSYSIVRYGLSWERASGEGMRKTGNPSGGHGKGHKARGKGQSAGGNKSSHALLSAKERYQAVEGFWKNLNEAQQREFLSVGVKELLELVEDQKSHAQLLHVPPDDILWHVMLSNINQDALNEEVMIQTLNPDLRNEMLSGAVVVQAIQRLRDNGSKHACYWRCPSCSVRLSSGRAFLDHVATHHEAVQYACEDTPLLCLECAQEVVGAFYFVGDLNEATQTGRIRCLRCAWEDNPQNPTDVPDGWELHVPRDIIVGGLQEIHSLGLMSDSDDDDSEQDETGSEEGDSSSYESEETGESDGTDSGDSVSEYSTDDSDYSDSDDLSSEDSFVSIHPPDGHQDACPVKVLSESPTDAPGACCTCSYDSNPLGFADSDTRFDTLESRIRFNSEDQLLATIVYRIDTLAMDGDVVQFESAITNVVQQTQKMMHGALSSLVYPEVGMRAILGGKIAERIEAKKRLSDKETFPDQATEVREALGLLNPSEMQDLLTLMAKKYAVLRKDGGDGEGDAAEVRQASKKQRAMGMGGSRLEGSGLQTAPSKKATKALTSLPVSTSDATPSGATITNGNKGSYDKATSDDKNGTLCVSVLKYVSEQARANSSGDPNGAESTTENSPAAVIPAVVTAADMDAEKDSRIVIHDWWASHLIRKTAVAADLRSDKGDSIFSDYLLQWIFGNVAHAVTVEFLDRQRIARGNKPTDRAIMDSFAEIAETWRHLAATMDRKRHISTLREAVAEDLKAVADFDNDMADHVERLKALSEDFHKHVTSDPILSAVANKTAAMDSRWSQKALQSLQMFHQLKDEASIRYAQALIDREIAVLELADVMDQHKCDVAERELQTVDAALAAARQDLQDSEADLARMQNDGPAVSRRRDALDRVNKEAEHRERLLELQTHISDCQTRIHNEQTFGNAAQTRRADAVSDLALGRVELTNYLDKRQALDRACHAVLQAQERDKGQELTDAFVDARIKAVWQVVEGVADAIRMLHSRYTLADSAESKRHARCTALAKTLSSELDDRVRVWWEDLAKLRQRASDMALVDLGRILEHVVMEVIRRNLEGKAAEAREAATLNLLEELEREEQAKKAAQTKKAKKKAGKAKKAEEAAKVAAAAAAAEARTAQSVEEKAEEKKADEIHAERQREMEYEAALEKRRIELQKEKEKQEAELRKIAGDVSFGDEADKPDKSEKSGGAMSSTNSSKKKNSKKSALNEEDDGGFQTMKPKASRTINSVPPPPPPPPPGKPGHGQLTIKTDGRDCEMRIITYYGDWNCHCGKINRLWDTCACGQIPPCRDWVRGRCTYGERCRFGHPPFELPDSLPRPKSPIAKPGADAIIYKTARNPEVTAAATAKHTGGYYEPGIVGGVPTVKAVPRPTPIFTSAPTAMNSPIPSIPSVAPSMAVAAPAPPPLKPAPWAAKDAESGVSGAIGMSGMTGMSASSGSAMTSGGIPSGIPSTQLNPPMSPVGLISQLDPLSPTHPISLSPTAGVSARHMHNPPMSPTGGFGLSMSNPSMSQGIGMAGMSMPQSTAADSGHSGLGEFGLFDDTNSLMGSLGVLDSGIQSMGMQANIGGSGMQSMGSTVDENLVNRAFAGLDLGGVGGVNTATQNSIGGGSVGQGSGQQQGFFHQGHFMGIQQQSMQQQSMQQSTHQQMQYQGDIYAAPFQSSPMHQMGAYGQQQSPIGNFDMQTLGMQRSNANNEQQQQQTNDDWNDMLLPSDLLGGSDSTNFYASDANNQQYSSSSTWGHQQQF